MVDGKNNKLLHSNSRKLDIIIKSVYLPRQGERNTCNSGINGAKWGNKSDDSATELPVDYFWAVLKAEMYV